MPLLKNMTRVVGAIATAGLSEAVILGSKALNNQASVEGGYGHTCGTPRVTGKRCRQIDGEVWVCKWCGQSWVARYWQSAAYHHVTWKKIHPKGETTHSRAEAITSKRQTVAQTLLAPAPDAEPSEAWLQYVDLQDEYPHLTHAQLKMVIESRGLVLR